MMQDIKGKGSKLIFGIVIRHCKPPLYCLPDNYAQSECLILYIDKRQSDVVVPLFFSGKIAQLAYDCLPTSQRYTQFSSQGFIFLNKKFIYIEVHFYFHMPRNLIVYCNKYDFFTWVFVWSINQCL